MAEQLRYEIQETLISINDGDAKWNTELNLVSWNGREPKYDIRKWSPDHTKMGKGISMSEEEAILFFQQAGTFLSRFRSEDSGKKDVAPVQLDFVMSDPKVNQPPVNDPPPAPEDLVLPFD